MVRSIEEFELLLFDQLVYRQSSTASNSVVLANAAKQVRSPADQSSSAKR
jgi:hypothetical protein